MGRGQVILSLALLGGKALAFSGLPAAVGRLPLSSTQRISSLEKPSNPLQISFTRTLHTRLRSSPPADALPDAQNILPPAASADTTFLEPLGRGIASDIKNKAPYLGSDITDGLNIKTLSAVIFLFFACIAPAVAFGSLMGVATAGQIGSIEMLTATAGCGIFYALTSGQPVTIIGSTGPVLAFTAVLYKLAVRMSLPFLPLYSWVGLWSAGILAVCSAFSVSNILKYFTRFTDEIFSLLISVIFIYEAIISITKLFLDPAVSAATALLSLVVASTTFMVGRTVGTFRRSPYANKPVREVVSDFAPTIGIATGVGTATWVGAKYGMTLATLNIPVDFVTTSGRPWLVPLRALPVWARWASAIPALMGSVLLFMDQNITVRLVNSKEHKMKKGHGYHLDMAALSLLIASSSVLGLPWLVAATVRSLAHVKALAKFEASEGKEEITGITEQRVSGVAIHTLIGLGILYCRPLLAKMPVSVFTGVFMYMGVGGLKGNQMWDRVKLLVTDPKLRPKAPWSSLDIKKVHKFTLIQMAALASMWWIKGSSIGIFFPVIIAMLAPLLIGLRKSGVFTDAELELLDSE